MRTPLRPERPIPDWYAAGAIVFVIIAILAAWTQSTQPQEQSRPELTQTE